MLADLAAQGWPAPVQAESGNGCIALYAVDLPNDAASTSLVERMLQALSARYDTDHAVIDPSVTYPARLVGPICRVRAAIPSLSNGSGGMGALATSSIEGAAFLRVN